MTPRTLRVLAPAKLNLGLEVLHRRSDGFHEIRTVMVAVSIFDRLQFNVADRLTLQSDDPDLPADDNLVVQAAHRLASAAGMPAVAAINLRKRIPVAAGLGGASSDAAAALVALTRLWKVPIEHPRLAEIAAAVGSDVPFLLHGGVAFVGGRGNRLTLLPRLADNFFVVVAPRIVIPAKTATLYGQLRPSDFSDGQRVQSLAAMASIAGMPETALRNAFARPLYDLLPELRRLPDVMRSCGARLIGLSGAGPAHYAVTGDSAQAHDIARRGRDRLGDSVRIFVCRPVASGPILTSHANDSGGSQHALEAGE